MDKTLEYYEINADKFSAGTIDVEFGDVQNRFLSFVPDGGTILDFGCGSGRDTKYFMGKGYLVDATDGSEKLCEIAGRHTGIEVKNMLFSELDAESKYDGIWACSSVLHLPKRELKSVFAKMIRAVKPDGYIYSSFKYGNFEGYRNDRYFTDFTQETFHGFIEEFHEITITEEWVSSDVR
ncbi:MAG: class I SAM-dependent methyltransferase, partial [Lachnospiraceae bacterium]|nr:class I SAM-dependent methyltransferase [Lachnospiraceae bacterium]